MAVAAIAVGLFFTGLPLELIALGAVAVLLLGRVKPEKVYRQIDWGLLVMFPACSSLSTPFSFASSTAGKSTAGNGCWIVPWTS